MQLDTNGKSYCYRRYFKTLKLFIEEMKEEPRFDDRFETALLVVFDESDSVAYLNAKVDAYDKFVKNTTETYST